MTNEIHSPDDDYFLFGKWAKEYPGLENAIDILFQNNSPQEEPLSIIPRPLFAKYPPQDADMLLSHDEGSNEAICDK